MRVRNALLLAALVGGCGRAEEPALQAGAVAAFYRESRPYMPHGHPVGFGVAVVHGTVRFEGRVRSRSLDVDGERIPDRSLLVGEDGTLRNAFVWIERGLEGFDVPAAARTHILELRDDQLLPRVLGARVGDRLEVRSPRANFGFDAHLPRQASVGLRKGGSWTDALNEPTSSGRIVDAVRRWRVAHVRVLKHPFFAVTGGDGAYRLERVPAGRYRLAVWHERLGLLRRDVNVDRGARARLDFRFRR